MLQIVTSLLTLLLTVSVAQAESDTVCLIMGFHEKSLIGIDADLKNYNSMAKNMGCKIVSGDERDLTKLGKDGFLKNLAAQTSGAKNIVFMYSGHGQCIENFDPARTTNADLPPQANTRLSSPVIATAAQLETKNSTPSHFAMDARNNSQCEARCATRNEACLENCQNERFISETDMSDIFRGKSVSAIVDSCGSGCLKKELLGAKDFTYLSSGIGNQSTLENANGGQLNLRMQQLLSSPEVCNADSDRDGQLTFAEASNYFSMGNNNRFSPLLPTPIEDFNLSPALVSQSGRIEKPSGAQAVVMKKYSRDICTAGGRSGVVR